MGTVRADMTDAIVEWIARQHMFFVATAPLHADGHVNLSPKGLDTFAVLGPDRVAYLDLTGSGAETIAHLRENGRITIMFCAFSGPPRILRLYGTGSVVTVDDARWATASAPFAVLPGARAVIEVDVHRVADSCGYAVPRYDFVEDRRRLVEWAEAKEPAGLVEYRRARNARSIDDLPGF